MMSTTNTSSSAGSALRISRSATLVLAALALLFLLLLVPAVGQAKSKKKQAVISAPRANQTVKGTLRIKPKVKRVKGQVTVKVWIDGKLYNKQVFPSRKYARSPIPFDTREIRNGRHRLKVSVTSKSKPRTASESLRFRVSNSSSGPSGAGKPAPATNEKNYRLIAAENFSVPAPLGSFASADDPTKVVYTGTSGVRWLTYPQTFVDTFKRHPYRSDRVLSAHNDVLDYWLHNVDGLSSGASISPIISGDSQYQTYGRYSARMRIGNSPLTDYHLAFLLWPYENSDYEWSESDFPEQQFDRGMAPALGYAHYGPKSTQEYIVSKPIDMREWHVYTQEWAPGVRRFYLDGKLIHTTSSPVWSGPQRWQLQVQSFNNSRQSGHLYVDWAAVWAYAPGTPAG